MAGVLRQDAGLCAFVDLHLYTKLFFTLCLFLVDPANEFVKGWCTKGVDDSKCSGKET